jgi:mRNA export factor
MVPDTAPGRGACLDGISSLQWSPVIRMAGQNFSQHLAGASWDKTVRVWDVQQNAQSRQINMQIQAKGQQQFQAPVLCCAWDEVGQRIFCGDASNNASVWDLGSNAVTVVARHQAPIHSIQYLNGLGGKQVIATAGWDNKLAFWDTRAPSATPIFSATLPGKPLCMDSLYKAGQGMIVVCCASAAAPAAASAFGAPPSAGADASGSVLLFDLRNPSAPPHTRRSPLCQYPTEGPAPRCVAIDPDCTGYCIGSVGGRVAVCSKAQAPIPATGQVSFCYVPLHFTRILLTV